MASIASGASVALGRPRIAHARPPLHLLVTEPWRAAREYVRHRRESRDLAHAVPQGDGHLVIVFPGLATDASAVRPLRDRLRRCGYDAIDWGWGFNTGPGRDIDAWLDRLERHVRKLMARHLRLKRHREAGHDGRISLVGWSLGGIYAREIAKRLGRDQVRRVVTIGTPFNAGSADATHAAIVYRLLNGVSPPDDDAMKARIATPPPVPTTSLYSRRDGIVPWQACRHDAAHPQAEDVELDSSHLGMGWNPEVFQRVAQRLATA